MKLIFQNFRILIVLVLQLSCSVSQAYDWEEEEGGTGSVATEREISLTRNRIYAGGADEQDLKVQKFLTQPSRSPEIAAEVTRRDDAEPEDGGVNE